MDQRKKKITRAECRQFCGDGDRVSGSVVDFIRIREDVIESSHGTECLFL